MVAHTSTRIAIFQDHIDPSRIRLLPRNQYLLVMDRISGRWTTVGLEHQPYVQLIGVPTAKLPEELRARVQEIRRLLIEKRIGVPEAAPQFEKLNTVIIKLTNACNLACAYCYDFERAERATMLDRATALDAMSQALDLCDKTLWVILHGGEPMLAWPLIEDIVESAESMARARGKEISFAGQTNMTRVTERIVAFSLKHHISWGVSVDGDAVLHDKFRIRHNGRGSFDMFMQSLKRFPKFVRSCGVMSTITSANESKLLEMARFFRDLGMTCWDWSLFQPTGRGREEAHRFKLDSGRLGRSWLELFKAVQGGEFRGFAVKPVTKYLDNFMFGPGRNMCMRSKCGAARDLLSISADGTIEACDCIDPTGPLAGLGHLATGSLSQARESPMASKIRARNVEQTSCGECIWYGVCGGTCMAHAGNVDSVSEDFCSLSLLAFDEISLSLVQSDALLEYAHSLH